MMTPQGAIMGNSRPFPQNLQIKAVNTPFEPVEVQLKKENVAGQEIKMAP